MSDFPWFRFYTEACGDRKMRRLKPEHRWLFVACLCAARQSPKPGWLMVGQSPMDWDDLVDFAAMPLRAVEQGMDALQDAGLVQLAPGANCWFVPSWDRRQFVSDRSTERVRKHRAKQDGNVSGTPLDTETEAETDIPPGGVLTLAPNNSCSSIVAHYVRDYRTTHNDQQPSSAWRGQAGKAVARLLDDGIEPDVLRKCLTAIAQENKAPSVLGHVIADYQRDEVAS